MRTRSIPFFVATIAVTSLTTAPALMANIAINVEYQIDQKKICVTEAKVVPFGTPGKDVTIDKADQYGTKLPIPAVVWTLKGPAVSGVTWTILEVQTNVDKCPSPNHFNVMTATCTPDIDPAKLEVDTKWIYRILAKKEGCVEVEADPAIIFRGGGTPTNPLFLFAAAIAGLLLLFVIYRLLRKKPRVVKS